MGVEETLYIVLDVWFGSETNEFMGAIAVGFDAGGTTPT